MKNHFQAVEKMWEMAADELGPDVEGQAEIDWSGTVCEGGLNVKGHFHNAEKGLNVLWDAAWQEFVIEENYG